jgi:hypothetical protein
VTHGCAHRRGRRAVPPEFIDPRELLFSLPTINDGVPAVEPRTSSGREREAAILHEDDWRQQEFALAANVPFVESTLTRLRNHIAVHRAGLGFREIFVRPEPPHQLMAKGLTLHHIRHYFDGRPPLDLHLLGGGSLNRVVGGFAWPLSGGGFLYGQQLEGSVAALGLHNIRSADTDLGPVARLTREHALVFVDWLRHEIVAPGDAVGLAAWAARAVRDTDSAT